MTKTIGTDETQSAIEVNSDTLGLDAEKPRRGPFQLREQSEYHKPLYRLTLVNILGCPSCEITPNQIVHYPTFIDEKKSLNGVF